MKATSQDQVAKTLVVNPAARRCGVDDQFPVEGAHGTGALVEIVDSLRDTQEYLVVSDRLLNFAQQCDQEISSMASFLEQKEYSKLEASAQKLTSLATDIGASSLIRTCYQLLIHIRQNQFDNASGLIDAVEKDYQALKAKLRFKA